MSWDFSTEPEFQKKFDWARDFMRAEVMPLETLELDWLTLLRVIEPLKKQVKELGTVGRPS